MNFFWLPLIWLSFANAQDISCFVPGICEDSTSVGFSAPSLTPGDCLAYCKNTTNCNYFSHEPASDICVAFSNCVHLSVTSCPDCKSGHSNCTDHPCFEPGRCLGTGIGFSPELDQEACLDHCRLNAGCLYFTFDTSSNVCFLYSDCPTVDESCLTCVHGQRDCELPDKGPSKLLLVGGNDIIANLGDAEIIDLLDPDSSCEDPVDYPGTASGPVMAMVSGAVWLCGGWWGKKQCYNLDIDTYQWISALPMLQPRTHAASTLLKGGNEWWIAGGGDDWNGLLLDSTELLRNGEFVTGRDLPQPMRGMCFIAVNDSHVFLAGGHLPSGPSNKAYLINLDDIIGWQPVESMSIAREQHSCALITSDEFGVEVVVTGGPSSTTEIFSVSNLTWRSGPSFPKNLYQAVAVPFQDSFIIIGGFFGTDVYDQIYKFNVDEWKWDELGATLTIARAGFGALMLPDDMTYCSN